MNSKVHVPAASLSPADLTFLADAARYLERPTFLIKATNLVGKPTEAILNALPGRVHDLVAQQTHAALQAALKLAVRSLSSPQPSALGRWSLAVGPRAHVALASASGAVGGLFGLPGAAAEIPVTTTLMMRSIAQIAERNGSSLHDPETLMHCLAVFSFGSPRLEAMDSAFLSSRLAIAEELRLASAFIAKNGAGAIAAAIKSGTAPVLVRFLGRVAAQFQIVVTEKLAAQAVPVAGALAGSLVNAAFTDHFNRVAEFHFGIMRLERLYGRNVVQTAYREAVERTKQRSNDGGPPSTA
jgi:EcsC protein family